MRFIGDVHGKFDKYIKIIKNCSESIQVGDMGVGFFIKEYMKETKAFTNPPVKFMGDSHRYIRGNHDNPLICQMMMNYIPDGTYDEKTGMMFIGGANSIDKQHRTPGFDWWFDEELSYEELKCIIQEYEQIKPRIMVTHECPDSIANELFGTVIVEGKRTLKWTDGSRTRQAFDSMFEFHKPDIWIHGHWHESRDRVIDGTRFICLAELEYIDIEI